jgi:hypothetical protein
MKKHIKASHVANEIRMKRTLHKGAFLIVEGDTDSRFYKKFVQRDRCRVVVAHDKHNAVSALKDLERSRFKGVLGIVDADFMRLDGTKVKSRNLLLTDTHDLETLILSSGALENVLVEFAEEPELKGFQKRTKKDLRRALLEAGAYIGYLRWFALKENVYLRFNHLDFKRFVAVKRMKLNNRKLIQEVLRHSKKTKVSADMIERAVTNLSTQGHDLWQVCVGHDLVFLLFLGLKDVFGSYNTRDLSLGALEGSLRLAYDPTFFRDTRLYNKIRKWEKANTGYPVLISSME